ncbi:MAG: M24 family metallopeptidase [Candidatus Thermoplasmatota archaeon]|nr:M24 family metallopeptidase [Candidatus Thermoplasmatota archaeon]
MSEFSTKLKRVHELLDQKGLDGVVLFQYRNFAWITCGKDNRVPFATEIGGAPLLITKKGNYAFTNAIEYPRIKEEELQGKDFEFVKFDWTCDKPGEVLKFAKGMKIASDAAMNGFEIIGSDFAKLRYSLTEDEVKRYEKLGGDVSKTISGVAHEIRKGMTEYEIAAQMEYELKLKGIASPVTLVGTDERIRKFRHPIPTSKKLEKYAMLVTCAEKYGLVVAMTRFVHFGKLDAELAKKRDAVAKIDAAMMNATKVGTSASDVLAKGIKTYVEVGFADEWKLHHQGGAIGYATREYTATPSCKETVQENQAFAWNPSITGAKSEDTMIAKKKGYMIITEDKIWPLIEVEIEGKTIKRPDFLEL